VQGVLASAGVAPVANPTARAKPTTTSAAPNLTFELHGTIPTPLSIDVPPRPAQAEDRSHRNDAAAATTANLREDLITVNPEALSEDPVLELPRGPPVAGTIAHRRPGCRPRRRGRDGDKPAIHRATRVTPEAGLPNRTSRAGEMATHS